MYIPAEHLPYYPGGEAFQSKIPTRPAEEVGKKKILTPFGTNSLELCHKSDNSDDDLMGIGGWVDINSDDHKV